MHKHEQFDHTLYLQHAGFDSVVSSYKDRDVEDASTGLVRSKNIATEFFNVEKAKGLVAPDLLVHKTSLQGNLPNQDFTYFAQGSATEPQRYAKWLAFLWPITAIALVIGWFLKRRTTIREATKTDM